MTWRQQAIDQVALGVSNAATELVLANGAGAGGSGRIPIGRVPEVEDGFGNPLGSSGARTAATGPTRPETPNDGSRVGVAAAAPNHDRCFLKSWTLQSTQGRWAPDGGTFHGYPSSVLRVLITGISGTGKSTLVHELRRRGCTAYDADDDGYTEPRGHGGWGWRTEAVQELFDQSDDSVLFFAGCSEEQAQFDFDVRVLLSAPETVIVERLKLRTTNSYGSQGDELARILSDRRVVEPILRRSADLIVETTKPIEQVADLVVGKAAEIAKSTDRQYRCGPPRGHYVTG